MTVRNRFHRPAVPALFIWCALGISTAFADDASKGVMLPGLEAVPSGSVHATEASITLSGDQVVLQVALRRSDSAAALVIRGPVFGWLGEADAYPTRQFPELRATIDGVPAALRNDYSAFFAQKDITGSLQNAGLDPFAIASTPPFVDPPAGTGIAAFNRLVAAHAVSRSDGQYLAQWTAQRIVHLNLGERPTATLSLAYLARPGFGLMAYPDIARTVDLASYCIAPEQLAERLGPGSKDRHFIVKTYAVAAGVDGRPPEHLSIRANNANTVFCSSAGHASSAGPEPSGVRAGIGGIVRILQLSAPG